MHKQETKAPDVCSKCEKNKIEMQGLIKYRINGVAVYHDLCNACLKTRYLEGWQKLKDFL